MAAEAAAGSSPLSDHEDQVNGTTTAPDVDGDGDGDADANADGASATNKDDAGLFGEDEDEEIPDRTLDDPDLDSGDDLDRNDRALDDDDQEMQDDQEEYVVNSIAADIGVHPGPAPSDGELYLMRIPKFLAFEPTAFDEASFQPPTTDLHSKKPPTANFDPRKAAMNTIRWRHDPKDPSALQSNARVLRWDDGSLTLQLANDPQTQYMLSAAPLQTPQHEPKHPTPMSTGAAKTRDRQKARRYDTHQDSFMYLAAPSESASLLRITNKLTTQLLVEPSRDAAEEAARRLQENLDAASKLRDGGNEGGVKYYKLTENPELPRMRAEQAEKEREKAERKRENQMQRMGDRGGHGPRRIGASGLTLGGLETSTGGPRRPGAAAKARRPRQNRGEILSDEEDGWAGRGRTREDEYDADDGFLAASDEEEEEEGDDGEEDEEEDIDEGIDLEKVTGGRKRKSPADEEDADGEPDEDEGPAAAKGGDASPASRSKRRRVVDEDEDE